MRATARRCERFERIVHAFVLATGGRLPVVSAFDLLQTVREAVPDTSMQEIAAAIRWAICKSKRLEAKLERDHSHTALP